MSTFSIRWLLFVVAYVAICFTALLNANNYWRYGLHAASLLLILTAILGTIFSAGQRRAFWTGCLVFGAAWFLPVFGNHEFVRALQPRLINAGFTALHGRLFSPTIEVFPYEDINLAIQRGRSLGGDVQTLPDKRHQVTFIQPSESRFTAAGEAALCVPVALLGGLIATWFWQSREAERASHGAV